MKNGRKILIYIIFIIIFYQMYYNVFGFGRQ